MAKKHLNSYCDFYTVRDTDLKRAASNSFFGNKATEYMMQTSSPGACTSFNYFSTHGRSFGETLHISVTSLISLSSMHTRFTSIHYNGVERVLQLVKLDQKASPVSLSSFLVYS